MKRGEIWLVAFPFSSRANPPFKKRPVLVLSNVGTGPDQAILVAMVTSNQQRLTGLVPGDVPVSDWQKAGLVMPSTVRSRRLWTAERRDFPNPKKMGDIGPADLGRVLSFVRSLVA